MTAVSVTNVATKIADPGNRDFVHIFNNGAESIFLCYDGSEGVNGSNLTTNNGIPVRPNGSYTLDNTGPRQIYNKAVYAIAVAGPVDVRVQGA
jgi:hypothetical protein